MLRRHSFKHGIKPMNYKKDDYKNFLNFYKLKEYHKQKFKTN